MKKIVCILTIAVSAMAISQPVPAEERDRTEFPWERASLTFGYFLTNFSSDVRLTKEKGVGAIVNIEELLGLDDTTHQFRLQAMGRPWRKHRFYFSYYDLSRDARRVLDADIPELELEAGIEVETAFDLKIYKVSYSYSFFQDNRLDLHGGIGFHIMDIGVGLKAKVTGGGDTFADAYAQDTTLPLPVLGLGADVAITPKLFLKQSIDFFYITLSDFEGLLLDANVALEYNLFKYFGLGAGFNLLRVDIRGEGGDAFLGGGWNGDLKFNYSGIQIYGKLYF